MRSARTTLAGALLAAIAVGSCSGDSPDASGDRTDRARHAPDAATDSTTTSAPPPQRPDDVVVPHGASEVAATLVRVERAIRSSDYDPVRTPPNGWQQQVAYGTLLAHPEWLAEALALLPPDLQPVVTAVHAAGSALSAPDLNHTPSSLPDRPAALPDWTIVAPPPPDVLLGYYREAEAMFAIPWQYLAAIHFLETKMGRIHGNSTAGAQGPMQFIPSTWDAYGAGGDVNDNRDAILAAARYLRASGGPADMDRALLSYNPSDAYVVAITGYASVMASEPRAYYGFYQWQVFVATADGDLLLPEGWTRPS